MSNKKLSRLLEPNLKFYFAVMLLFAVAAIPVNWQLALAEGTLTVLLYFYFRQSNQKRRQGVLQYIDSVTGSVDTASKSTLINSPLPTLVFRPDTGEIIWSNESFLQLAGVREHLFEMRLSEAVPDFQVQWLLSGKQESPERVELNNHRFRVYGSLVRSRNRTGVQSLVATTYWVETTEADHLREVYEASRPVAAILMLDNYEDLMKACEDTQRSAVLAQIDEKLQTWANAGQGILLKTDRNHYLFLFEEQYFQHFVDEKFSILDTVRAIRVAENIHPTLSIGIGKDSPSIPELYKNAKLSLEMALSRGGDQAVVRNQVDFAFYGGRTKATEKRTKVKSRVMANAFRELIADAGEVYIMAKYASNTDSVKIRACYNSIPAQLAKDNKKFQYKVVQKGGSAALFGASIEWLNLAGVVLKCQRINQAIEPIAVYTDLSAFKLYMGDVGLLTMKSGLSQQTVLSGEGNTFMGAVTENYVAQQLAAKGYDLYYWESSSTAELDFVLQKGNQIVGVEVKKGEHVRSRSLSVFVDSYKPAYSVRLSLKNFGEKDGLKSVPLYAAFCV